MSRGFVPFAGALCCWVWFASAAAPADSVPISAPAATEPVPAHQTFTMASTALAETRRINLYLPPGYSAGDSERYPILYVLDGGLAEDFPHVASDVDAGIRAGALRPLAVAGIENTERRRDLTGPTSVASDRAIAPRVGGSAAFRAFLCDELLPEIERRVRADGERALIGESLAGLFVLETFFERPAAFDTYVALSPSLWWNDRALARGASTALAGWPRARAAAGPRGPAVVYLATAGDDGQEPTAVLLDRAFAQAGLSSVRFLHERRDDLLHATIYRGASPEVFRRLFAPPAGARDRKGQR